MCIMGNICRKKQPLRITVQQSSRARISFSPKYIDMSYLYPYPVRSRQLTSHISDSLQEESTLDDPYITEPQIYPDG